MLCADLAAATTQCASFHPQPQVRFCIAFCARSLCVFFPKEQLAVGVQLTEGGLWRGGGVAGPAAMSEIGYNTRARVQGAIALRYGSSS